MELLGYMVIKKYLQQDDVNDPVILSQETILDIGAVAHSPGDYEKFTKDGNNDPIDIKDYYTLYDLNLTKQTQRIQNVVNSVYDFFEDKDGVNVKVGGRLHGSSSNDFGNFEITNIILKDEGYGEISEFCLELTSNNNSVKYVPSDKDDVYVLSLSNY